MTVVRDTRTGGLEVEIGCGNGHFIAEYAARVPDAPRRGRHQGEALHQGPGEGGEAGARQRHDRARERRAVHAGDARGQRRRVPPVLPRSLAEEPSPQAPVLRDGQPPLAARPLADGGRLCFATDFFDYYVQAKVLAALHRGFILSKSPPPRRSCTRSTPRSRSPAREDPHLHRRQCEPRMPDGLRGRKGEQEAAGGLTATFRPISAAETTSGARPRLHAAASARGSPRAPGSARAIGSSGSASLITSPSSLRAKATHSVTPRLPAGARMLHRPSRSRRQFGPAAARRRACGRRRGSRAAWRRAPGRAAAPPSAAARLRAAHPPPARAK